MSIALVTGPARSGKSRFAETLTANFQQPVTYVATARRNPDDAEWQVRIDLHIQQRPNDWTTLEVPLELPRAIANATPGQTYLIDSLGTWVANWIESSDVVWQQQVEQLLTALHACESHCVFVGEEVGWSVVPAYELGRRFRDRMGLLNQQVGAISDAVYLVTAGFAIDLRQVGIPVDSGVE
ncbi:MAG: bifunctional adenosylcobinamide kinase/adenosylcobinamide-phosphate guanylyltransferase [Cyanobacteria bacterium P01_A01_bin.3]